MSATVDIKDLKSAFKALPLCEVEELLREYSESTGTDTAKLHEELVVSDMQSKLLKYKINSECPYCKSAKIVRFGANGVKKRFKCKECGKTFSLLTNTILDGTQQSWGTWVKVVSMVLNHESIEYIRDTLIEDMHIVGIGYKSVFLWVHKIIHAIAELPMPTLKGIIQVDETFFRENQKGSRDLVSTIPGETRFARSGKTASKYGCMGNEFANVVVAVGSLGYCVSKVACLGKLTVETFSELFDKHIDTPTYFCSDGNSVYKEYCRHKDFEQYVKPSNLNKIVAKALKEYADKNGIKVEDITPKQEARALDDLYRCRALDYLRLNGIGYLGFKRIKETYKLSLGRVDQFHNELKLYIEKLRRGVATKYLQDYVGLCTFAKNWKASNKIKTFTLREAEKVLVAILKGNVVFKTSHIRKKGFNLPKVSGRYMATLIKKTEKARLATGDYSFEYGTEDNVASFDKRRFLENCQRT